MSESSTSRTLRAAVWGVLAGGAVGFVLGLLTAPEEGRRIRRRVAYQLDRVGAKVSHFVDDALNPDEHGEARRDSDAVVADAEEQAQRIRQDIDALIGEMRQTRKTG